MVKFKVTRSVPNKEAELLYRIPVLLRQQQCCKIASARKKIYGMFPNIGTTKSKFHRILKTHQWRYYRAKCVSVNWVAMAVECECAIGSLGGGLC
jgi:hypothetical protein